jgi:hypothetical protein
LFGVWCGLVWVVAVDVAAVVGGGGGGVVVVVVAVGGGGGGGVVVLFSLYRGEIRVGHCNHALRGKEA